MSHKKNHPIHFRKKKGTKTKKLRIGAADYTFITCSELSHEGTSVAGLCDVVSKTIYVNADAHGSDQETLIHEMVHAAIYEYGVIQHEAWCSQLEEIVAEVMSKIVVANFHQRLKT